MSTAIKAHQLGKAYTISHTSQASYRTLRESVTSGVRNLATLGRSKTKMETFWALRDVSFEIQQGEKIGIIGRNGAGKSTLLKLLSRITEPTEGRVELRGRVGSLLEVGTGFHPELTGRENIYLNGAVLGMSKAEINRKFDEIVEFAGVEKFLDTPIKRYSSGMQVRLGFSVAAHLEPEILLVDEVLSVGDFAFQQRSLGKMEEISEQGRTVLFVSHNMEAVQNLCESVMWLEEGELVQKGKVQQTIDAYIQSVRKKTQTDIADRADRIGNGKVRFTSVRIYSNDARNPDLIRAGDSITVEMDYQAKQEIESDSIIFSFPFINQNGIKFADFNSRITTFNFKKVYKKGTVQCMIPKLPLNPGVYRINAYVAINNERCDWVHDALEFEVLPGHFFESGNSTHVGWVLIDHQWEHKS